MQRVGHQVSGTSLPAQVNNFTIHVVAHPTTEKPSHSQWFIYEELDI